MKVIISTKKYTFSIYHCRSRSRSRSRSPNIPCIVLKKNSTEEGATATATATATMTSVEGFMCTISVTTIVSVSFVSLMYKCTFTRLPYNSCYGRCVGREDLWIWSGICSFFS